MELEKKTFHKSSRSGLIFFFENCKLDFSAIQTQGARSWEFFRVKNDNGVNEYYLVVANSGNLHSTVPSIFYSFLNKLIQFHSIAVQISNMFFSMMRFSIFF